MGQITTLPRSWYNFLGQMSLDEQGCTMNPFTKFLSQSSTDHRFMAFVERWDELERIVISVYRGKTIPSEEEDNWQSVGVWLRENYGAWEGVLLPYWRLTSAAGNPTSTDPFLLLLSIGSTADIAGNWRAMQHLPAARETINRYILDKDANAGSR